MRDASGTRLFVGDTVFIYWGNNELRRGTVQTIQGNRAKVLVDAFPTEKDDNLRYSLSKWKAGSCMIKHYEHRQNALNAILTQTPQKEMFYPVKTGNGLAGNIVDYESHKR